MRLPDALGALSTDEQFAALSPVEGQPAPAPWRLAVVTVLQDSENPTDRHAATAVRERIDRKDSPGWERSDAGFDFSVWSAFRTRLVEQQAETLLRDRLLSVCKHHGWLKEGGTQRTASTQVLACVRSLSNLEGVGETLRAALNGWSRRSLPTGVSAPATGESMTACRKLTNRSGPTVRSGWASSAGSIGTH
jgi:transposase